MGYVRSESGGLCCDHCGEAGARKRPCPYRVTYPTGGSLPYCPAPALCAQCYKALGGLRGVHGSACALGAAKRQTEMDGEGTALARGESLHRTSWGDWHPTVPNGTAGVRFVSAAGEEIYRLISNADYEKLLGLTGPHTMEALLREGGMLHPWADPNARSELAQGY